MIEHRHALESFRIAESLGKIAESLGKVVSRRAKAGSQQDADKFKSLARALQRKLTAVSGSGSGYLESSRYVAVAYAQLAAGDIKEAHNSISQSLAAALSTEREILRDSALRGVAEAATYAGQFREALAIAQRIKDDDDRDRTLRDIVEAQMTAGKFAEAAETAEKITSDFYHAWTLSDIAKSQGAAGRFREALTTVEKINRDGDDGYRDGALFDIAEAQGAAGRFAEALATGAIIADESRRAWAFAKVAEAQITTGADQID